MEKILVLFLSVTIVIITIGLCIVYYVYYLKQKKHVEETKTNYKIDKRSIFLRDVEDEEKSTKPVKLEKASKQQEEIDSKEKENPQTLDMAYLNLEDSESLKRSLEEEHVNKQEIIPTEKNLLKKQEIAKKEEEEKRNSAERKETKTDKKTNERLQQLRKDLEKRDEYLKKKAEDCVEMNLTRENSSDETLKMWIYRTMKVNPQKVERVRTGTHSYEYRIYNHKGEDVGKDLLTPKLGGSDPRKRIWVLNNEGNYEHKEVDSLLLTPNGRYGFATDRGNGPLSDVPTTYQVARLPGGEYIAIQALEQQKRNREASNNMAVKDITASKQSDYQMKDKVKAVKTAKDVTAVQKDGKTDTREVEIVEMLEKEGLQRQEIDKVFEEIYEGTVREGMTYSEVEKTGVMIKDLKEQGCSMEKIKQILKQNEGKLSEKAEENETVRNR